MKKRLLSLFLLLTLLLTLVGCGDDTATNKTGGSDTTVAITSPVTSATKPAASSTALQVEPTDGDETKATTSTAPSATKPTAGSSVITPSITVTAPPTTTTKKRNLTMGIPDQDIGWDWNN